MCGPREILNDDSRTARASRWCFYSDFVDFDADLVSAFGIFCVGISCKFSCFIFSSFSIFRVNSSSRGCHRTILMRLVWPLTTRVSRPGILLPVTAYPAVMTDQRYGEIDDQKVCMSDIEVYHQFVCGSIPQSRAKDLIGDDWETVAQVASIKIALKSNEQNGYPPDELAAIN